MLFQTTRSMAVNLRKFLSTLSAAAITVAGVAAVYMHFVTPAGSWWT